MKHTIEEKEGVSWITLEAESGLKVIACTVGAGIYAIEYKGKRLTLVLSEREKFIDSNQFFGKTLARVAGRLPLEYHFHDLVLNLPQNEPADCLHGQDGVPLLSQLGLCRDRGREGSNRDLHLS